MIFAAVLSKTGGSRKLFQLGEASVLKLIVGPSVLRECETVVERKAPGSLPGLARLLDLGGVSISPPASEKDLSAARAIVYHAPDAQVLAEAIAAQVDWLITHDKAHFLVVENADLGLRIGTPGDLIQALEDDFTRF